MATMTIKNRITKVSPGGVITLPVAARKTLAMEPGKGARVTVAREDGGVSIRPSNGPGGVRVSSKGQLELVGEPRALLEKGVQRHFWLELDDAKQTVALHPYV